MNVIILQDIMPSYKLKHHVRKYELFRFIFENNVIPPVKYLACRPEHSITFYLRDAQRFSMYNSETIVTYPRCIINGIYTSPMCRYGGHDFWAIKVIFQPTTLFQLVKTHMKELVNNYIDAEDVFGDEVKFVWEQLCGSEKLSEIVITIESYLEKLIKKLEKQDPPFIKATKTIMNCDSITLDWLADQSCLSMRQFIRKFEEHVGIGAKVFYRIVRFEKAFRMKNKNPYLDWLSIAVACGYHDYQHLVKDFKEFAHLTPPAYFEVEKNSPERRLGLYEI